MKKLFTAILIVSALSGCKGSTEIIDNYKGNNLERVISTHWSLSVYKLKVDSSEYLIATHSNGIAIVKHK